METILEILPQESFLNGLSNRMRAIFLIAAAITITTVRLLGGTVDSPPAASVAISVVVHHTPVARDCPVIGC